MLFAKPRVQISLRFRRVGHDYETSKNCRPPKKILTCFYSMLTTKPLSAVLFSYTRVIESI